jgi:hypothetical protein
MFPFQNVSKLLNKACFLLFTLNVTISGLMAIDGIEVHVVSRPFDERFNMEFVFVFNDTLDDGNRLLISRYLIVHR